MLGRIGFARVVESCGQPQSGSNQGYAPTQLILQPMLSVAAQGHTAHANRGVAPITCWVVGIRQKIDGRANAKGKQLSLFADDAIFPGIVTA